MRIAPERSATAWLVAHLTTLALAAGVLAVANRHQWFFGDEWEFLVNRGFGQATLSLWSPHNEHWSTIPIVVYVALRDTVGLGSYWPFISVLIATHLALAHVLWRVALRAGAAPALATAGALVFAVLGAGYENLLWAFQIGFIGSLLFGWIAALVADTPDRLGKRDVGVVALLIASLMCSGIGVPMVAMVSLFVLLRSRSWLRAGVVGAVPGVVFVVWYVLIGDVNRQASTGGSATVRSIATSVGAALVHLTKAITGAPGLVVAGLLLICAIWWIRIAIAAVRGQAVARQASIALVGPAAVLAFFVMVSLGRSSLDASRYVYVVAGMAVPAMILALSAAARRPWMQGVAVALLAVVGWHNLVILREMSDAEAGRESLIRETVVAAASLADDQDADLSIRPETTYDPDITLGALRGFVDENGLPDSPVTPAGLNGALLGIGMTTTPDIAGDAEMVSPSSIDGTEVETDGPMTAGRESCWLPVEAAIAPQVHFAVSDRPESFRLESVSGGNFDVRIGAPVEASQPRTVGVSPGADVWVRLDLPVGTEVTVGLGAGGALCVVG